MRPQHIRNDYYEMRAVIIESSIEHSIRKSKIHAGGLRCNNGIWADATHLGHTPLNTILNAMQCITIGTHHRQSDSIEMSYIYIAIILSANICLFIIPTMAVCIACNFSHKQTSATPLISDHRCVLYACVCVCES